LRQAWAAYRTRGNYGVFVSFSEKVGLPLALLLGRRRRIPHVLIAHNLTSERKRSLQRRTGYLHRFDRIVVLCHAQERYLLDEAGVDPQCVCFVEYMVDRAFWTPGTAVQEPMAGDGPILAVGRERRDYPTLVQAARLLPQREFVIVASSPWSRARSGGEQTEENVSVRRNLSYGELRVLYERAAAVVVPLETGTAYAAGVNGVLEAMAMGHGPIVARTPGIADYVEDGVTGRWVAPGDPEALAAVIQAHLRAPDTALRMGIAGRAVIEKQRNLERYIARLTEIIRPLTEHQ
jgi:glycosyltransferase involved in cell wall biosynthesis